MGLTVTCRHCGDVIPGGDLRRTLCEKEECKASRKNRPLKSDEARAAYNHEWWVKHRRKRRFCKICNRDITETVYRTLCDSTNCRRVNNKNLREASEIRRIQRQTDRVRRRATA